MTDKEIVNYLEDTVLNLKNVVVEKQQKDLWKIDWIKKDMEEGGLGLFYETTSDNEDHQIPEDKPLIEEVELDIYADEKDKQKLNKIYEKYRVTMSQVKKQMSDRKVIFPVI